MGERGREREETVGSTMTGWREVVRQMVIKPLGMSHYQRELQWLSNQNATTHY